MQWAYLIYWGRYATKCRPMADLFLQNFIIFFTIFVWWNFSNKCCAIFICIYRRIDTLHRCLRNSSIFEGEQHKYCVDVSSDSIEQRFLTWVRRQEILNNKSKKIKFTTYILFLQLRRVRWMHVWNLWGSIHSKPLA